jgi:hypothetical protein
MYLDEVVEGRDGEVGHAETRGSSRSTGLVEAVEAGLEGGAGGDAVADAGGDHDTGAS